MVNPTKHFSVYRNFSLYWRTSLIVTLMTPLWFAVSLSPLVRVAVAESQNRDLHRVDEWCDLCGMRLNASKTKTMIVLGSRTMHSQVAPINSGELSLRSQ